MEVHGIYLHSISVLCIGTLYLHSACIYCSFYISMFILYMPGNSSLFIDALGSFIE
jgi:hypothetical protein